MRVEEIDALLGGEAQRLADKFRNVPLDFMDGYGWAVTQICRLYPDAVPVIRCRDCKFLRFTGTVWKCQNRLVMMLCEPNDYCSRAERKEE